VFRPLGSKDARGFYSSFEIASETELLSQWSTPEQQAYNASTKQCPDCRGWGYRIQRRGKEVTRENVGCQTCLGLGKIPSIPQEHANEAVA